MHGPEGVDDAVLPPLLRVAEAHALTPLSDRLRALWHLMGDDLQALEAGIAAVEASGALPGTRVAGAASHLLSLPGKRIRPLCVLLAARLGERHLDAEVQRVAVACELVHAATLLHDDVIDDGKERRGAPTARLLYGNAASVLAGDHLLVRALQHVMDSDERGLLGGLLEVMARMVAAEALQLERRGHFTPQRDIYLEVIRGKTAALFAWGLRAGGTLGGLDAAALAGLDRVGLHLGTAFQLVDDVLDLEGDPDVTGKEVLVDIREGKLTWPVILAAESDPGLRRELQALAAEPGRGLPGPRAAALVAALRRTGSLAECRAFAAREAAAACREVDALPPGRARSALACVIEAAVERIA